jgi:hypothetical protein
MQSILFIFPEGNISNNPSLLSLVLLLIRYYTIYFICEDEHPNRLESYQVYQCIIKKLTNEKFFDSHKKKINEEFNGVFFSLIIGIDQGIKFANFITKKNNTPLALISYEIYFKNEWNSTLKQQEIKACKNIVFAICQDSMRSYLLSYENNIPLEKIANIPISEMYNGPYSRSTYLHEKLNISYDKKIVLYIGSLGTWTNTESLVISARK